MYLLESGVVNCTGKVRELNEDNFYLNGLIRDIDKYQNIVYAGVSKEGFLVACVCDGVGGASFGDRASFLSVCVLKDLLSQGASRGFVRRFVEKSNEVLCTEMKKLGRRMGSTMAMLVFWRDTVSCFNLGDSKCYMLRDGSLEQLSHDHSEVARMIEMGMITKDQAKTHKNRHVITQYLGVFPEEMILEPYIFEDLPIRAGDVFLVCSDGVTDMLEEEEIKKILSGNMETFEMAKTLRNRALDAGGRDNITAIVVKTREEEIPR